MQENIVAEIKISGDSFKLVEAFISFFAPDIQAVCLRIFSDETTGQDVIFSDLYPWQADLLPRLREQCLEYYPPDREQYPFLTPKAIISVGIQLLGQTELNTLLPSPQLIIFNTSERVNATLDFGHRSCFGMGNFLAGSGRLLDQALIVAMLQHICQETPINSLYLLKPHYDASPWNCSFVFYHSPKKYLQDLWDLECLRSNIEHKRVETSIIFRGQTEKQTEKLYQCIDKYILPFERYAAPSANCLVEIWQQTQRRLGALSNFDYFITKAGIGLFTNNLFETYCYQPYLALLKSLYHQDEILSAEDIDAENFPAPTLEEILDQIFGKVGEEKTQIPAAPAATEAAKAVSTEQPPAPIVVEQPTPEQLQQRQRQVQEAALLATFPPDEIEIELQLTLGQLSLAQQCLDAASALIEPGDLNGLRQFFQENVNSLTALEQILKTPPNSKTVKNQQRRQYLPSLGKSKDQLELLALRQDSFKALAKIDPRTSRDNQVWLTNPAQIVRKITYQNLQAQATVVYEVPLGDSVTWSNSKMPMFWMNIDPPHLDQIIVSVNATVLAQVEKPQSVRCKINISGAEALTRKRFNALKQLRHDVSS
jgi:hypothetical protein